MAIPPSSAFISFRHAPVSKSIFFASAAATLACFSSKTIADFFDAKPSPTLLIAFSKHVLRLLPFRGVSDALFGLYMLYWFRCFERMMGPRKYFSLAAASALLSATLQSVLSSLFDVRLASGPYSLLYFGLVLYYREIPASLNFSMLGFRCSNKIFAYILAAQIAISSVPSPASTIATLCSVASALAVTSEDLPIHKFRIPKGVASLASSVLGPLLGYPPSPAAAIALQPLQQQQRRPPGGRRPDAEQDNLPYQDPAFIEALLRQQLHGDGLRGRLPRQPQPQPQPPAEDVDRVVDFSGCDRPSAIQALLNNAGDVEAAVNELLQ